MNILTHRVNVYFLATPTVSRHKSSSHGRICTHARCIQWYRSNKSPPCYTTRCPPLSALHLRYGYTYIVASKHFVMYSDFQNSKPKSPVTYLKLFLPELRWFFFHCRTLRSGYLCHGYTMITLKFRKKTSDLLAYFARNNELWRHIVR